MTSLECQSAVYDLAAEFFSRANINVARQNAARPPLPFVTLNFGIVSRVDGISAVKAVVDGVERRSFSVQQNCTIELVTKRRTKTHSPSIPLLRICSNSRCSLAVSTPGTSCSATIWTSVRAVTASRSIT